MAIRSAEPIATLDPEEARWVKAMQAGDRAAFARLIRQYQSVILAYGLSMLGDEALARDLCQEVLVTFWRDRGAYRHQGKLRAYLLTIARHRGLAQLKRQRSSERLQRATAELPMVPVRTPLEEVQTMQQRLRLRSAIQDLPPDRAEVIQLRFVLGLPVAEIAEIVGVPVGTVKSRIGRGLAGLRQELSHED